MELQEIITKLNQTNIGDYPSKMDPLPDNFRFKTKIPSTVKHSAVLLLLFEKKGQTFITLTQRHEYEGAHSGQISFPGGKKEDSDLNLQHTALRETEEEIGISQNDINVIYTLKELYIPPSNFLVQPYIATIETTPIYTPDKHEVKEIIEFPISRLLEPDVIKETNMEFKNKTSLKVKYYDIKGKIVWGATAMILENLVSLIGRKE